MTVMSLPHGLPRAPGTPASSTTIAATAVVTTTVVRPADDEQTREPSLRQPARAGMLTIAIAFGGFFSWAFLAQLDHAAVAPGVFIVDSHRKTVQHLEGGILAKLLVREGDRVSPGQPLVQLDTTLIDSQLGQLETQYWAARAREARLRVEERGADTLTFPEEILQATAAPERQAIRATEQRLFQARLKSYTANLELLRRRIAETAPQAAALEAQRAAVENQRRFSDEELETVRGLLEKGYERRPRLLELQRRSAELSATLGEIDSRLAQARQVATTTTLELAAAENARSAEIFAGLQESQGLIAELTDRIRGARDIRRRTQITAPQDGLVTNIRVFTQGGVIGAGEPILDIVPFNDELVVEAKLEPRDIDAVHPGMPASVRLTAYSRRSVPEVEGEVTYVAADLVTDERTGQGFYTVRVKLSQESLAGLDQVRLYPGMPAEVMLVVSRRYAIDYLLSPIFQALTRAGHER